VTTPAGPEAWKDVRVSLGADAEVTGKLSFTDPTRVEGKLKGELKGSALIVIGSNAVVEATIDAERLIVLGKVLGNVTSKGGLEIRAGGRVVGDVDTRNLVVDEGGVLEGRVSMNGGRAA
jgi:cytoskeletal protein CcmA (bactofilin family)